VQLDSCPTARWIRWTAFGALLLAGACGSFGLWLARWWKKGYKEIANQDFMNTDVLLDGHLYINCRFTSVTFVYNGGDCGGFTGHCLFSGVGLKTGDPKLGQMLAFVREIRMMREDSFGMYTPRSPQG
jgi:hypothetical protein